MLVPFIPGCSRRFVVPQRHLFDLFNLLLEHDMFYAVQNANLENRTLTIQIGYNPLLSAQHEAIEMIELLLGIKERKAV